MSCLAGVSVVFVGTWVWKILGSAVVAEKVAGTQHQSSLFLSALERKLQQIFYL